jgi:hypothetical protein
MKTEKNIERSEFDERDLFLKSLFSENHLMSPSLGFTAGILAKIHQKASIPSESVVSTAGKNITFLIFILIALINLILVNVVWPYVSVWLPEEGILRYLLENLNTLVLDYALGFISSTFTFSLLFIIALASFSLFGVDGFLRKHFGLMQNGGATS